MLTADIDYYESTGTLGRISGLTPLTIFPQCIADVMAGDVKTRAGSFEPANEEEARDFLGGSW